MIAGLKGRVFLKDLDRIVIDVHGVRYECMVSQTTLHSLPDIGEEADLLVHTHLREDALVLFGFNSEREKRLFHELTGVSGIGPKLALTILSGMSDIELAQALVNGDVARLTSIPGIGKKTAERMVVELKDKLAKTMALIPEPVSGSVRFRDEETLAAALANLGYKPKEVDKIIERLASQYGPDSRVEDLLRAALQDGRR